MSDETSILVEPLGQATGMRPCGAKLGLKALGGRAQGERLERIQSSPYFDGTRFRNAIDTPFGVADPHKVAWQYVAGREERVPRIDLPVVTPERGSLRAGQGEDLRLTWMGHSTVLLEIDGSLVLTDPVFGPRAAPVSWMGPKRFHRPPLTPEELPPLDLILVSHDHYDHLDYPTIRALARRDTPWVTTLGVGAHLEAWGVPAERITELSWWEEAELGGIRVVCTPSRHFAGRGPGSSLSTHWASWALMGAKHKVWFSGDTGPWPDGFSEIGERLGGFDLTLIEIGAWHPSWGNIHLGPDNAADVHRQVRGKTLMPVHWGTFNLGMHAWDAPILRLLERAAGEDLPLVSPMMGETVHRESGVSDFWRGRWERARLGE